MIGTSDQSCWLAEACKILLLLLSVSFLTVRCEVALVANVEVKHEYTHCR